MTLAVKGEMMMMINLLKGTLHCCQRSADVRLLVGYFSKGTLHCCQRSADVRLLVSNF